MTRTTTANCIDETGLIYRTCNKCNIKKPATTEFFYQNRVLYSGKIQFKSKCKKCYDIITIEYIKLNPHKKNVNKKQPPPHKRREYANRYNLKHRDEVNRKKRFKYKCKKLQKKLIKCGVLNIN